MQEFSVSCTPFIKQFQFKDPFGIWKTCLHESCIYQKMLKLSCFAKNPVLPLFVPVFVWNWLTLKTGSGGISHGFGKNGGRWSLILRFCPCCPLGKIVPSNFRILSFTSSASKGLKFSLFRNWAVSNPKWAVSVIKSGLRPSSRIYLNRITSGAYIANTQHF